MMILSSFLPDSLPNNLVKNPPIITYFFIFQILYKLKYYYLLLFLLYLSKLVYLIVDIFIKKKIISLNIFGGLNKIKNENMKEIMRGKKVFFLGL